MANPTSNFGWQMPTNTDLVKDLPADFEVFGQAVDTSLMDLKGGTTGQVLSKASNTDMDFTWVTSDDANAIQNTIVDAKGDLISATGNDVPARLAVGNNGESLVADSSATTGLRWQGNFAAGKNKIINGDFNINQRAFSSTTTSSVFTFDRWATVADGGTSTFSAQTFTLGSAPVAGYEGTNFIRINATGQSAVTDRTILFQRIENIRTLANQTATISFWAKASSGTPKIAVEVGQNAGTGGSPSSTVNTYGGQVTLSTSWARYSVTLAIPSISGLTLGTNNNSFLALNLWVSAGSDYNSRTGTLGIQTNTFDIWGVQIEAGNVATAFQTATGTLQGELAACQRYYVLLANGTTQAIANGFYYSTTEIDGVIHLPVAMRQSPSIAQVTGTNYYGFLCNSATDTFNSLTVGRLQAGNTALSVYNSSEVSGTAGQAGFISTNNASSFLAFSAEL